MIGVKKTMGKIGRAVLPRPLYQRAVQPIGAYLWRRSLVFQQRVAGRVMQHYGTVVQGGPFAGMNYLDDALEGCIVPKFIGCYEEELFGVIERLIAKGYNRVVDVGCASGYYVVGFALRLPDAQVYGFDIDQGALERCQVLADKNDVANRVTLGQRCTHADLERLAGPQTLIFCDIDGGELDLIDPALAPALRQADLVVETHDYLNPLIGATIVGRFRDSHRIEIIPSRERDPAQYPALAILPRREWAGAVDERRPRQQEWAVMEAR